MPYKLSPSSLKLMKECHRCFWLHFNKGIKRPETPFPTLPAGMDRILKEHFDSFMGKGLPPELQGLERIKLFDDMELLGVWRNNLKGIQWTDGKGNLFRGAVDNILQKDGKLIVLDYKTRGYPLKEDTAEIYQDQLDVYNFLLRKNGFETDDYGFLLFYHPDKVNGNGDVVFHKELVKMEIDVGNAENKFKEALEILEGELPKGDCGFCKWAGDNNFNKE